MSAANASHEIHIPAGGSRGRPLLVMLHGCRQDAHTFAAGTGMNALADRHAFVVLYPQQSRAANALGCWNWFHPQTLAGRGEARAIAALVHATVQELSIDSSRVYVAGMSAGGAMAGVLAACHGSLFAACAIHSGVMYGAADTAHGAVAAMSFGSNASPEATARARLRAAAGFTFVPTLVIHGDDDTMVHPANGEQIVEQARHFAAAEAARSTPLAVRSRRVASGARHYRISEYARRGRIVLRHIVIEGLGHAWSGGDERHPFNDAQAPRASALVWEFVSRFRRPSGGAARQRPALLRWLRR
jgi:poly(hydroxyalkanoate) depolymerase family esterase